MNTHTAARALMTSLLLAVALVAAGCGESVVGSGTPVTKTYDFSDFTRVQVSHAFEVQVTRGTDYKVEVVVDEKLVDNLEVEQDGDLVRIGLDNTITIGTSTRRATIVLPKLVAVTFSGATKGAVSGFTSSDDLAGKVSGASSLTFTGMTAAHASLEVSGASKVTGELKADRATVNASGASRIELTGSVGDADLEASGASDLELGALPAQTADVQLSGASDGSVAVVRRLSVDLSGASKLVYEGNPTIGSVSVNGASTFERRD